jgi:hypothetical protein
MRISRQILIGAVILAAACTQTTAVLAGGLSTQLGEVVIENLQVGQTYDLKELANLALTVTNTSERQLTLRMDVLTPADSELRRHAEPIPDVSWVSLSDHRFELPAGAPAVARITLAIPDDPALMGRTYQFMIWSHSLADPGAGMTLAYGLKSRIIFGIDTVRANAEDAVIRSDADAGLSLSPYDIRLADVPVGEAWDVAREAGIFLKVENPGPRERTVRLSSRTAQSCGEAVTEGYEDAPDPSFLTFSEDELVIPSGEAKRVRMYLDFAPDRRFEDRQYMFIIQARTVGERVTAGVYSRLYASMQ